MIATQRFDLREAAVSLLSPPVCTICGTSIRAGEYLCDQCEAKAVRISAPFCEKCSEPFDGSIRRIYMCQLRPSDNLLRGGRGRIPRSRYCSPDCSRI